MESMYAHQTDMFKNTKMSVTMWLDVLCAFVIYINNFLENFAIVIMQKQNALLNVEKKNIKPASGKNNTPLSLLRIVYQVYGTQLALKRK